jgi:hypothetical protein
MYYLAGLLYGIVFSRDKHYEQAKFMKVGAWEGCERPVT